MTSISYPTNLSAFFEAKGTSLSNEIPLVNRGIQIMLYYFEIGRWYESGRIKNKSIPLYKELLSYDFSYDRSFNLYEIPSNIHSRYPYLLMPACIRYKKKEHIPQFLREREQYRFETVFLFNDENVYVLLKYKTFMLLIYVSSLEIIPVETYEDCIKFFPSHLSTQVVSVGYRCHDYPINLE
jgi:hypothetical protein